MFRFAEAGDHEDGDMFGAVVEDVEELPIVCCKCSCGFGAITPEVLAPGRLIRLPAPSPFWFRPLLAVPVVLVPVVSAFAFALCAPAVVPFRRPARI